MLLAAQLLAVVAGCSGPSAPLPAPVMGKVLKEGKPLATVVVKFWPEDAELQKLIKPATATTGEDGRFRLETPPGKYKVTLFAPPQTNLDPQIEGGAGKSSLPHTPRSASIPSRYGSPSTTPLNVEVLAGGTENVVLAVMN